MIQRVTWTAPEIERPSGSLVADEHEMLRGDLAWHRSTFLLKCAGLTGEQLAQRADPPSTLSLLGLIRHLAKVERIWFRIRFAAEQVEWLYGDYWDLDFNDLDPSRAEAEYAQLVEEMRLADAAVADAKLDDRFEWNDQEASLRFVYLHMIGEYARHNGHADLLREHTDGVTGG
jgi:Protein of unknown function (DUF664)